MSLVKSREAVRSAVSIDEEIQVRALVDQADLDQKARRAITIEAYRLIQIIRSSPRAGKLEQFLVEYGLSTQEGVALMCLAEAMLRVPDNYTIDELIRDKIVPHDWSAHLGSSGSLLVNLSTWALMLTGQAFADKAESIVGTLHQISRRLGEPVVREVIGGVMRVLSREFILGRNTSEAIARGRSMIEKGYTYSFDMLGEAARTESVSQMYFDAYLGAISDISQSISTKDIHKNAGISVKLSALHSRYERSQRDDMLSIMVERVLILARAAAASGIGLNIDAEESDRLDLSLDVIGSVLSDSSLSGWDGFGVVVQAYDKRAPSLLDWLYRLTGGLNRRIMVRLVKGAYWDQEIKHAQVLGVDCYPVFSRKAHTDVSYLACGRKLLGMTDRIYPQFATHNAHTVAAVLNMAGDCRQFEFQRLHGMGEALHEQIRIESGASCRIYAPIGEHRDLLAYLVRRLLENGASDSFVHQLLDKSVTSEDLARDPIKVSEKNSFSMSSSISMPSDIFKGRRNSKGWNLNDPLDLLTIEDARLAFAHPYIWSARSITSLGIKGIERKAINPAVPTDVIGYVYDSNESDAKVFIELAVQAQSLWVRKTLSERVHLLQKTADLYEDHTGEFLAILCREAGKNLADGIAEIREAVDFLRYYGSQAEQCGIGGQARGVIVCISPWNFPLAIFTGQIAAALVTGNTVIAKPAEETPLIAALAVNCFHEAGVPKNVIQLILGSGSTVGASLVSDTRINGVCFTGSLEVAKKINRELAEKSPDAMFIAETGGLNAMIVDSTALMEQAVDDIIRSAFQSAGQRCSALRILYVQKEVEAQCLEILYGAMDMLRVGDPWLISTDVGSLINAEAEIQITSYIEQARLSGRLLKETRAPSSGFFVAPTVIRVDGIEKMSQEVFGPVLHIARYLGKDLSKVIDAINTSGFGLTLGLHTRIDRRVQDVIDSAQVGNLYVNRDQIGAVVGSQPFGGERLSGTGPKAGGPLYLERFTIAKKNLMFCQSRPASPIPKISGKELMAAIEGLKSEGWGAFNDRIAVLEELFGNQMIELIKVSAAAHHAQIILPGPTGELNQYRLVPKGLVLCLGSDMNILLMQVLQALAMGNHVVVVGTEEIVSAIGSLERVGIPMTALNGELEYEALVEAPIDLVALAGNETNYFSKLRKAVANRPGSIVQVIGEEISLESYCYERVVCVDMTATGGNVSLLAALDS